MGDKPFAPRTSLLPLGEWSGDEGTERNAFIRSSVGARIKCVEPIAVSLPMAKPMKMAGVEIRSADNVLVRIETDGGHVGWGEAASAPAMTGETVESMMAAIRHMAPSLANMEDRKSTRLNSSHG